jgi:hypothetical protein
MLAMMIFIPSILRAKPPGMVEKNFNSMDE